MELGWPFRVMLAFFLLQRQVSGCHPGGMGLWTGDIPEGADGCNRLLVTTLPATGPRRPFLKGYLGSTPWSSPHNCPQRQVPFSPLRDDNAETQMGDKSQLKAHRQEVPDAPPPQPPPRRT